MAADADFARARELVLEHGETASAYQILNPGIAHWFSGARDAVVGHARYRGHLVVAGAPVCAPSRLAGVIDELESDAASRRLRVCYFGVERSQLEVLRQRPGRAAMRLGAQPVWNPGDWSESVGRRASLRAQLHRARNKGVVVHEWPVRHERASVAMGRCLGEWLATRGAPPMHFLVEPWTLDLLEDRRVFVAERAGETIGFLVASPVPRRQGWIIEQIIRGRKSVNGTSELLVDAAIRSLEWSGSRFVTLGLSPLSTRSSVGELPNAPWLRLLLTWLRAHGRRFYNFDGLDSFKAKLGPHDWEPIYAVTDRGAVSPSMLLAIAGVFTAGAPFSTSLRALASALRQELRQIVTLAAVLAGEEQPGNPRR